MKSIYAVDKLFLSLQGSILLFTPLFSRLILQFKLQPQEFITGMAIEFFFFPGIVSCKGHNSQRIFIIPK